MQGWTVITESLDLLEAAAAAVSDANQQATTPCARWTAAQVLQHAAGDQLAWAAAIGVGSGPAENPFAPSGHLLAGVDDLVKPALATARAAWASVKADDAVPTPLPQGPLPAELAAGACALDAAVHAWDIAAALGRSGFLPAELAGRLLPAARAVVEPLRAYGAYAAALAPQPEDDSAAELLRYLGRDPRWTGANEGR
ncbi:MAG TPA: TIGR03086 family metal-binding protein [Trebonia sp.]